MLKNTVKLACGPWSAEILPEKGANTVRLARDGRDILRPLEDPAQLEENPFLRGTPILLPANRTDGAVFSFDGRRYTLPLNEPELGNNLHGILWSLPFTVLSATKAAASFRLDNTGAYYPFPFRLTVSVRLDEEGYHSAFEVENSGETDMPLTFALHTTFLQNGSIRAPLAEAHRFDRRMLPVCFGPLDETEKKIVSGFDPRGTALVGYYRSCGHTARIGDFLYTVSENFDYWVLFNADGNQDYVCVEPQAGRVNGLNDGGFLRLAPGRTERFETSITRIAL
ncbi:MAG: aldose 1-epimerase [Clostridia bacterium]|nr:aldose 1-epimerase [Clostridia bacterium]